ncbi:MAG: RelA/SpoT domain-containing protein [Verrucomicrobiales bacterium]|nr:RelA/SpoT domain-containing protein [Verrucomicrobiales bacterium]
MKPFSHSEINHAGRVLIADQATPRERDTAWQTLNDWRSLHLVPLNTFQATLRHYVKEVAERKGIVVQRLKRAPTILDKLKNRQQTMRLRQMQDIGGLRAIVPDIKKARELEKKFNAYSARTKHHLTKQRDYIAAPKKSGYRGIHIIYQYHSPEKPEYDGLYVEIQLRTRLQHLWATAVETVGFFLQEALKSSQGNQDWLDFFKLVSALLAREENEQPHADFGLCTKAELVAKINQLDRSRHVFKHLETIQKTKFARENSKLNGAAYWVIETLLNGNSTVKFYPFLESQKEAADLTYRQLEQTPEYLLGKKQVVLISSDSLSKIEQAYPNFLGDIDEFIKELRRMVFSIKSQ